MTIEVHPSRECVVLQKMNTEYNTENTLDVDMKHSCEYRRHLVCLYRRLSDDVAQQ